MRKPTASEIDALAARLKKIVEMSLPDTTGPVYVKDACISAAAEVLELVPYEAVDLEAPIVAECVEHARAVHVMLHGE